MERRTFTRVSYRVEAIAKSGKRIVRGHSENVSLRGLFFQTSEKFDVGKTVRIKLFLQEQEYLFVKLAGKVVRQEADGFAVQFAGMNFSTFMDLKQIVSFVVGDETQVISEFTKSLHPDDSIDHG